MTLTKFDIMANKDIVHYYNWIASKSTDTYTYNICAAVDPYSSYDIIQFKYDADGNNTMSYIELKGRNVSITDYDDCVIESYKVRKLQHLADMTNNKVYLVALYYPSSKLAIWEVDSDTPYNICYMECNHYTASDNPKKVMKEMVKFPLSRAKIYNFTYNIDNMQFR